MQEEVLGQIFGKVGKRGLENRGDGIRNILWVWSTPGTAAKSKVTDLNIVEREDDRLKLEMDTGLEPVLSGDGDPLTVGEKGICGPDIVWRGESKVCGSTDGREDVKVGKGCKDKHEDDCLDRGERSARCERSRDGAHGFRNLVGTIRMRTSEEAEG